MHIALDADATARVDATASLLAAACDVAALRASWADGGAPSRARWRRLADLGLTTFGIAEELGGSGGGDLDLVPLLEEVGYVALPEPLADSLVAARLLAEAAPDHAAHVVDALASGRSIVVVALGGSPYVALGADADQVVVADGEGGVHLAEPHARSWIPQPSVDASQRLARRDVRDPLPSPIAHDPGAVRRAEQRAVLARAAMLLGLARRNLDLAVEHARHRQQFGRPIGTYQALRHRMADDWTAIEFARPLVWRAAWSIDRRSPDAALHVAMAMSSACDAGTAAAATAMQVHGAMGYTFECDVHLFLRRTLVLSTTHGNARTHRAYVAEVLRYRTPERAP